MMNIKGKALNFSNILLKPNRCIVNSRSECDITADLGNQTFAAPVCAANMKAIITPKICKIFDDNKWFYVYHRINGIIDVLNFVKDAQKTFNAISISIGISEEYLGLLKTIEQHKYRVDYFTIDVAHSFTNKVIPFVNFIKSKFPASFLIVGNGCSGEWIEFLEELKVDCAKIGIGVSESCRTRQFTGFGSTTVSSFLECKQAAKNIKLMSDGGLTIVNNEVWIGDIAKALKFGADFVMSGSLFSRCLDSPSIVDGYYGNASKKAKNESHHVEGATIKIETNGLTTIEMIKLIEDSLKSSCSYSGSKNLFEIRKCDYQILF